MLHAVGLDPQGADPHHVSGLVGAEGEVRGEVLLRTVPAHPANAVDGVRWGEDVHRAEGAGGIPTPEHVIADHVRHVVGMEVGQHHQVHVTGIEVVHQLAERPGAQVEEDREHAGRAVVSDAVGLHEVAGRRRRRPGHGAGATDHGELHGRTPVRVVMPLTAWTSGRNRFARRAKSAASPVARKRCAAARSGAASRSWAVRVR